MKTPLRILDANGNRAREALRVLEEAARFLLQAPAAASELKHLRHDLSQALGKLPALIHHRDTAGDVGTNISTPSEYQRDDIACVVSAAGARLSEALRVIEEYAKVLADQPEAIALIKTAERVRYRGYDLTLELTRALGNNKRPQWRLCLLLTESLCTHQPWQVVLEQAIAHGVDAVQVREKQMDGGELLARVRAVIAAVNQRAAVIVNDRPDIALLAQADGVHLGQSDLSPTEVRKLSGPALTIGVSTCNVDQAKRAHDAGADYCGVGPMFATTTKHKPQIAGPAYLREYLAWGRLPHLAIGGINPDNIDELTSIGCQGVAVSSAICSAADPATATARLSLI